MSEDKPSTSVPTTPSALPESSMQDIIASISRIIAEDSGVPQPPRIFTREKSGILELTEVIEADGTVRKLDGGKLASSQAATQPLPPTPLPAPEPRAAAGEPAIHGRADDARESLVSTAAGEAAINAFGRLGTVAGGQRPEPGPALGTSGRTLEDIVCDALRPLLKAWLDDHLPGIVERLVHEEIQRLVREARSR
ncbi:MAG TPA: DUF2497 domain-containing protein [Stellaceae bacterium]|nr:DUF2497 domain-containing protein [Stellaceae bacterium]